MRSRRAGLSPAEREARRQHIARAIEQAKAERERAAEDARLKCVELWSKGAPVAADHPYVTRKRIKPAGAKQLRDALLIPLRDETGELRSLQFIQPDGSRRFKSGGIVAGAYCSIGSKPDADTPLLIAEGWATACSLHEATGFPAAAAMSAGNLPAVAQALRVKLPDAALILCADDDHATIDNPGVTKAREAAHAVGGALAIPAFGPNRPEGATDFNDLAALDGIDAVRACIEAARLHAPTAESNRDADHATASAPDETDDQAIERLANLKPLHYDRVRKDEARRMGVRPATLDRLVADARGDGASDADTPFPDVEPWHEPVDGAKLLSDLSRTVRRFIVCDESTAHAAALWITMTWLIDAVDVAPIAAITAPEKRCGKSQLLFLMGRLSSRPLAASNITPAALFRSIEAWRPTLLIDEADAFMRENEELRGLLNCGHTRDSAYVVRTVGDDHTPKQFFVWGAKAIAGIGHLADTLMDRSITLELRRKLSHEQVDKLRHAEADLFDALKSKLARWSEDNADAVRVARPVLPDSLHDRAADNWEPLFQIAEVAGGAWPDLARRAALRLSGDEEQSQSTGAELLADIQEAFETQRIQRISMADLLHTLLSDEEKPWATWRGGRPMTARNLGKKLGEYGIKSKTVKIGYEAPKGFTLDQFKDAFARYLSHPPESPLSSVTQSPPNTGAGLTVTEAQSRDPRENPSVTVKPLSDKGGDRVTDETPKTGEQAFFSAGDETEDDI